MINKTLLNINNIDIYYRKKEIIKSLLICLRYIKGIILDIGCGNMPYREFIIKNTNKVRFYIGLDIITDKYNKPNVYWDGNKIPFKNDSIDCVLLIEVLEHCPYPEKIIKEIFRILKNQGILFFTVPFLWPLHDIPSDEYRYTPFALKRMLNNAGYQIIKIGSLGGWDASLGQMMGLWVRRRPMSGILGKIIRIILSYCFFPIIYMLYRINDVNIEYKESTMITGIYGIACKNIN